MTTQVEIKVGDEAPDFKLQGVAGADKRDYSLSELRGKKNTVLLFYVLDWTPG